MMMMVIVIIIATIIIIIIYLYHLNRDLKGPCRKNPINNTTKKWQPCKADANHRLPKGMIKAQHDVQGVFVLKFKTENMGGPVQSTKSHYRLFFCPQ